MWNHRYVYFALGVALGIGVSYVYGLTQEVFYRLDRIEQFLLQLSQTLQA